MTMACNTHKKPSSFKENKSSSQKPNTSHRVHSEVITQLIWQLCRSLITTLKASLDDISSYFTGIFTSAHLCLYVWHSCWEFGLGTIHVQHPSWATIFLNHSCSQMLKWIQLIALGWTTALFSFQPPKPQLVCWFTTSGVFWVKLAPILVHQQRPERGRPLQIGRWQV